MKNRFLLSAFVLFLLVGVYNPPSYSQYAFVVTLANDVMQADSCKFDVYIGNTGQPLTLYSFQLGFTYQISGCNGQTRLNNAYWTNFAPVVTAAGMQNSVPNTTSIVNGRGVIKCAARPSPGVAGTGVVIPQISGADLGLKWGTITVKNMNGVALLQDMAAGLHITYSFLTAEYPTRIQSAFQLDGTTPGVLEITQSGSFTYYNTTNIGVSGYGFIHPLSLKSFIQGLYNGSKMVPDTVIVELHNTSSPYTLVDSQKGKLDSAGVGTFNFIKAYYVTPYYLVIKHRNGVETWSATTPMINSIGLTYDFSSAQSQAYGNNLVQVGTNWCIYSGDVNQDGLVDSGDLGAVDNDNANYVSGYTVTDVNGDLIVDSTDLGIVDNNNAVYIRKIVPVFPALNKMR